MLSMRAFHEWLSSAEGTSDVYQHHLALLTQVNLTQLQKLQSDVTWTIWWRQ